MSPVDSRNNGKCLKIGSVLELRPCFVQILSKMLTSILVKKALLPLKSRRHQTCFSLINTYDSLGSQRSN